MPREFDIDTLLAIHRAIFGGARMEDPPAPAVPPAAPAEPPKPAEYTPPGSQADLDRMISERVARERAKYGDYNDLKAKAARLDQIEQANASETEKAVKAAREEGRAEVLKTANERLVNAEVRALAAAAKFRDPTDAIAQLAARLGEVKVGDSGEVDGTAVKALLDELATAKPYLLSDGTTPPPTPGQAGIGVIGGTPQPTDPRAADMAQIERDVAAGVRRR
jgi:hypothetical protein